MGICVRKSGSFEVNVCKMGRGYFRVFLAQNAEYVASQHFHVVIFGSMNAQWFTSKRELYLFILQDMHGSKLIGKHVSLNVFITYDKKYRNSLPSYIIVLSYKVSFYYDVYT